MYGVTELQLYQTEYFEKEVLEMQKKYDVTLQKEKEDIDAIENLDIHPFELSLMKESDLQLDANLHLLPDQNLDRGLHMRMENAICQDFFGTFTVEELDMMFEHDMILNLEKGLRIESEERECTEIINDVEIPEVKEIHQEKRSSQTIDSPVIVDISKTKAKSKKLSLTPQKRVPQDQPQVETPTKRRRLSFKDTVASPFIEDVTVEKISAAISPQQVESQLQPLHSEFFVIKKSKKMIDKKISLKDKSFRQRRQNVNYNCKPSDIVQIRRVTPAKVILKQPSHWDHKQWAANLYDLFKKHTITRSFRSSTDENIVPIELMQTEEPLRAGETTSRLNLPTELSTLGRDATGITADGSALGSIANIVPMMNLYPNDQDFAHEALAIPLPEMIISETGIKDITELRQITDINEADEIEDIISLMERQHLKKNDDIVESPVCSIETSQAVSLTSHDILAMLEVLWCDQECIEFNALISDTYSPKDVTTAFSILLVLYAEQKIILMQKDCHDILWIRKYNSDFD
ncbi:uncharacterized protein LOC126852989 isoform X2 [Cataglyphis hispanica]|nr:uncharacterized protein LOC126852989 isoform X2 [Cataglyphis hispanica]